MCAWRGETETAGARQLPFPHRAGKRKPTRRAISSEAVNNRKHPARDVPKPGALEGVDVYLDSAGGFLSHDR